MELENHTCREVKVERRAEGHYPHLGASFTSFSLARRLKELHGNMLVFWLMRHTLVCL